MNTEPVITLGVLASAIVGILNAVGVLVDHDVVVQILTAIAPLVTSVFARYFVTPVAPDQRGM
jgi:hypothetical protein